MNPTPLTSKNQVMTALLKASTPVTIALFAVSAVTGVMLFFHLGGGPVKGIHEWLSMAFVIGAALHTLKNWRPFQGEFRRWPVWVALVLTALITVAFLAGGGQRKGPPGPRQGEMPSPTQSH